MGAQANVEVVRQVDAEPVRVRAVLADGWSCASWDAVSGPARLLPGAVRRLTLAGRNRETLRRLADLAEARPDPDAGNGPAVGSPASRARSHLRVT